MSQATIYKYPLAVQVDKITVQMPIGAQILYVDVQLGIPCVWALVDPNAAKEERHFWLVGTGNTDRDILDKPNKRHIGSVQIQNYVWHYFEELQGE